MILGIGTDLVNISRIERLLLRFEHRFIRRLFTPAEWIQVDNPRAAAHYAKRFAAKEALVKALGTGFQYGIGWLDIAVITQPSGKPSIRLSGKALAHLRSLTPPEMNPRIHLSLTDDYPFAAATILISADPNTS